ncbi:MAG: sulfoxide reductase heme-binding subunit YedZ [Sulfuriferula sp.]|nr:sulfoxide reductase heme-binding subunit YedZ [Sulfuriferula sp.]
MNINRLKAALFLLALYPLARLLVLAFSDGLGANPIEFITRSTGTWTLVGLMLTLTVTPLRKITGWHQLLRIRRMLGLFSFFYASLHFITYIWLDQFFDFSAILHDIYKRPFITVGFVAFLLLIPLALTSSNAMIRRLGALRWQKLHKLVYLIAILGVLHYIWLVKKDLTQPLIYATVLTLLLGWRVWNAQKVK